MTTLVIPPHERKTVKAARVRLGSFEFEKKGVSRFDLRDPYRLAVTLTWPQFLAALLACASGLRVLWSTYRQLDTTRAPPNSRQSTAGSPKASSARRQRCERAVRDTRCDAYRVGR